MAAKNPREYTAAPKPPDCSKDVTLNGDVVIDMDSINSLVEQICECIENSSWVEVSCPPCILIDGVVAQFLTVLQNPVTGDRKYISADGTEIDAATVEVVTDPCDPRCACAPCDDFSQYGIGGGCCPCDTLEDKQDLADRLAGVYA